MFIKQSTRLPTSVQNAFMLMGAQLLLSVLPSPVNFFANAANVITMVI